MERGPPSPPINKGGSDWLKDISTPDFSTPSFNPRPFNPRFFNHELSNPGLFNSRLFNHELFNPMVQNSWLESRRLKSSWLKSLGLKGPGLKLGVAKSRVEISFNLIKWGWFPGQQYGKPQEPECMSISRDPITLSSYLQNESDDAKPEYIY